MFRSTPVRSILCRKGATPTPAAGLPLRPFASPRLRHASTRSTPANSRLTSRGRIFLGALTCALLGYTVGTSASLPSPLTSLGLGRGQGSTEDDEPTYGTPGDFQKAIRELRHTFSNGGHESGIVSTDPHDLHMHGFSENVHHPGMCARFHCLWHCYRSFFGLLHVAWTPQVLFTL